MHRPKRLSPLIPPHPPSFLQRRKSQRRNMTTRQTCCLRYAIHLTLMNPPYPAVVSLVIHYRWTNQGSNLSAARSTQCQFAEENQYEFQS